MPMKTRLIRSRPTSTLWRLRTAATWPAISPGVRLRRVPSLAVRQNWQLNGPSYLAGDADGATLVGAVVVGWVLFFFGGLGAVAALAAVASGHPDGLDGLAVGHADEVALGAVDGAGGLDELGQAYGVALGHHGFAQGLGECGDLLE